MEGVLADVHVDPTVASVAQTHRIIPFIVGKLEAELATLEADGITKKVENPSS